MPGRAATSLGLLLALLGPILIALVGEPMNHVLSPLTASLVGELALVAVVAGVLLIVLRWERQPLSSIGLRPPRWQSLAWGLALAAFFVYVFAPAVFWALRRLHLQGFESGLNKLSGLPLWVVVLAVVIGGFAEEVLYRGYAIERLSELSGSPWIGGLVPLAIFTVAHVPGWGWGPALTTFVSGGVITLFYLWKRDLPATIIAHIVTDLVGIVVTPWLARG